MTNVIRNAMLSATPAFIYLVATFAARVISGWCDSTRGFICFDGYSAETVWRAALFELAPMLAVAWGGLLLGFLALPRVRLSVTSSLALVAIASFSVLVSFSLLGLLALALLPAAALIWSYWVARHHDILAKRVADRVPSSRGGACGASAMSWRAPALGALTSCSRADVRRRTRLNNSVMGDAMKLILGFATFALSTTGWSADVVYVQPPEEMGMSVHALSNRVFEEEVDGYAKAASLKSDPSGEFEIRIWRVDSMTGRGIGYVLRDNQTRTFDITRRNNECTARLVSSRSHPFSEALIMAARDVSSLGGYEYSCGIVDGESVLVEASIEGTRRQFWAGNPESCADKNSKRIAILLRLVDAEASRPKP